MSPETLAKSGTEHGHQAALFCKASQNLELFPELQWMFAVPNGGERNIRVAMNLKAEGVKSGVSDIFLPAARKGFHGLFLEMKKPGELKRTSQNQKDFGAHVQGQGYQFSVADNWIDAWAIIMEYLC